MVLRKIVEKLVNSTKKKKLMRAANTIDMQKETQKEFRKIVDDYKRKMSYLKEQEKKSIENPEEYKKELFSKEQYYLQRSKDEPDDLEACLRLSEIYMAKEDHKKAVNWLEKVHELADDDDLKGHTSGMLGLVYYADKQIDKAPMAFEEKLRLNPEDSVTHHCLGLILLEEGRKREAVRHIELACEYDPDALDVAHNLALAYEQEEKYQKAMEQWKKYLEALDRVKPPDMLQKAEVALQHIKEIEDLDLFEDEMFEHIKKQEKVEPPKKGEVTSDQFAEIMALSVLMMMGEDGLEPLHGVEEVEKKITRLDEGDLRHVQLEMLILVMFIATEMCQASGIPDEVLDKVHRRLYGKLAQCGSIENKEALREFDELVNKRYSSFYEALRNKAGAGPMWHFGRVVTENMFGSDDSYMNLMLPLVVSSIFVGYSEGIQNVIRDYPLGKIDEE